MIYYNEFERNAAYILVPGSKYKYSVTGEKIEVPDLYFAQYPVTNKQYRRFIEALPEERREEFRNYVQDDRRFSGDDQPVVGVSWYAAKAYCEWLTKNSKYEFIFRLPTEKEWEWAAGGGNRKYPWGNEEPDETRANYGGNVGQTTPVGAYPAGATPEGLMDMAGNVWEWMENWYDKDEDVRALRGGSWSSPAENLPCAARYLYFPDYLWVVYGFRVVAVQSSFDTLKL